MLRVNDELKALAIREKLKSKEEQSFLKKEEIQLSLVDTYPFLNFSIFINYQVLRQ